MIAPEREIIFEKPLAIMKYQVSLADYRRCVADGACKPPENTPTASTHVPVTGVSFRDAEAYAAWYSRATGEHWRLPTSQEWAYAAAERFAGNRLAVEDDPDNPAIAWIRRYEEEAAVRRKSEPLPRELGGFGPNSNGVYDMSGNVWEWTSSCYSRTTYAPDRSQVEHRQDDCMVHVVEGGHRTYMSNFIRDAKSGGCAVGVPPDNLGFRLVREPRGRIERLWHGLKGMLGRHSDS